MAERLDERHVELTKLAAGLDVNAHLRAITTVALFDPRKVQHTMHGVVRDLRGPFVVGAIQRYGAGSLQEVADHRSLRTTSKIVGKTCAQRRFGAPGDRTFLRGIVPTEKGPQATAQRKECSKSG